MHIELLSITPEAEKICEQGARTCYDSGSKITETSYQTLLGNLLKSGHLSVFEHGTACFEISGISRAASHQIVRHRLSSFSQRSQRYVNEAGFEFVTPPSIGSKPEAEALYKAAMKRINDEYAALVGLGIKKEDARFLLPNAASTTLVMTANFREWLHVIDMRVSQGAQWEIRELCTLIWKRLYTEAPVIFGINYFQNWSKDSAFKTGVFEGHIIKP